MATTNFDTSEQIRDHKLVTSIINRHGTEDAVFDDRHLALLQRFCETPTIDTRDQIVEENGWHDSAGDRPGEKAANEGNLSGFVIARHGTNDPAFDDRDIEMLKRWFEEGKPKGQKVVR
ncbi:hypothetical protein DOTSEDRAFT_23671 [Dothistroma septosporum NZE10]|uniref:Uncharacterized protein n=1 Tax=Dothistroma septosporum (strain NZE10 / CBS 128990) TaxID=675120 RepID=N1PTJ4_DOTSN|nr:hypothetical protein DOTSEDRAFT_23671 [Dothistroma septosporum NZE10]